MSEELRIVLMTDLLFGNWALEASQDHGHSAVTSIFDTQEDT